MNRLYPNSKDALRYPNYTYFKGDNKMSKAIRSYPKDQQERVIDRRIASNTKGLGYWAAVDAKKAKEKKSKTTK